MFPRHNISYLLWSTEADENNNKLVLCEWCRVIILKAVHYHYATVTQVTREMCGGAAARGCYATARTHSLVINK